MDFSLNRREDRNPSLRSWCRTCERLDRRKFAPKGFCKEGHPIKGDNRDSDGRCSTCRRDRQREYMRNPQQREYNRIRLEARRRAQGIEPRNFKRPVPIDQDESVLIPVEPFANWLAARLEERSPQVSTDSWAASLGLGGQRQLDRILSGDHAEVHIDAVDRALMQAQEQHALDLLYPVGGPA